LVGVDGPVGPFRDDGGADVTGVLLGDRMLERGGHEDVAILLEDRLGRVELAHLGEASQRAGLASMGEGGVHVEAVGSVDGYLTRADAHDHGAALLQGERRVQAHFAETLQHDALPRDAGRETHPARVLRAGEELLQGDRHAQPCGLGPPRDSVERDGLSRHAGQGVHRLGGKTLVGVGDPSHLALAGPDVGRWDVHVGAEEALLQQLVGEAPRQPLEEADRFLARVDPDAALRPAEGHVHESALVGHERGQGHHLVLAHMGVVADPALGRSPMVAVLGAVGLHHPDAPVVAAHGEADAVDSVARPHVLEHAILDGRMARRPKDVPVHVPKEAVSTVPRAHGR
jgi:hypothetical protein